MIEVQMNWRFSCLMLDILMCESCVQGRLIDFPCICIAGDAKLKMNSICLTLSLAGNSSASSSQQIEFELKFLE